MKFLRKKLHSLIDLASGGRVLFCFPRSHLWCPALKYLNECNRLRIWAFWRIGTLTEKLTFSSGRNPVVQWGGSRLREVGCPGLHCGQNDCFRGPEAVLQDMGMIWGQEAFQCLCLLPGVHPTKHSRLDLKPPSIPAPHFSKQMFRVSDLYSAVSGSCSWTHRCICVFA